VVGLAPELCSEKISRNRLGTVFVIPQKKVLISEVHGRVNSEARNGTEFREKIVYKTAKIT
jgi:hypothetical protein